MDVLRARSGILAALQQQGTQSRLGKRQRRKQPCRTATDDERARMRGGQGNDGNASRRARSKELRLITARTAQNERLIGAQGNIQREREMHVVALAGVDGAAKEAAGEYFPVCNAKRLCRQRRIARGWDIQGDADVSDTYHNASAAAVPARRPLSQAHIRL